MTKLDIRQNLHRVIGHLKLNQFIDAYMLLEKMSQQMDDEHYDTKPKEKSKSKQVHIVTAKGCSICGGVENCTALASLRKNEQPMDDCCIDNYSFEKLYPKNLNDGLDQYRPHPNTGFGVRINNALHDLNLERPDLKAMKDGQALVKNITSERAMAALLIDLQEFLREIGLL